MRIILYNGHEWEPGEPCKNCGMRKEEILQKPEHKCYGKKIPPAIIIFAAVLSEPLVEQLIDVATQLL